MSKGMHSRQDEYQGAGELRHYGFSVFRYSRGNVSVDVKQKVKGLDCQAEDFDLYSGDSRTC